MAISRDTGQDCTAANASATTLDCTLPGATAAGKLLVAVAQGMADHVGTMEQAILRAVQLGRERRKDLGAERAMAREKLRAF